MNTLNTFGTLYIIATPIGNLSDLSARAIETLDQVDTIYCEDTRVTKGLLTAFDISTKTAVYHQHSSLKTVKQVYNALSQGKSIAFVSDAGTPGISDPGGKLVEGVLAYANKHDCQEQISIVPIPGPSAAIAALSISGFPCLQVRFMGFPPHKKKRNKFFKQVGDATETVVFFESSHRIIKALEELQEVLHPERQIMVCRELTKIYETTYRGTISEILSKKIKAKGEFVIVVDADRG